MRKSWIGVVCTRRNGGFPAKYIIACSQNASKYTYNDPPTAPRGFIACTLHLYIYICGLFIFEIACWTSLHEKESIFFRNPHEKNKQLLPSLYYSIQVTNNMPLPVCLCLYIQAVCIDAHRLGIDGGCYIDGRFKDRLHHIYIWMMLQVKPLGT